MTDTEMGRLQEERLGESGRGERERGMWGVETAGGDEGKKSKLLPIDAQCASAKAWVGVYKFSNLARIMISRYG